MISKALVKLGHPVLLGCGNLKNVNLIADFIGPSVHAVLLHLSDPEHIALQVDLILQHFRRIDGLINNAAILKEGSFLEVNPETFT